MTWWARVNWWDVLGLDARPDTIEPARQKFRELSKTKHPDVGGSHEEFQRINKAMQDAKRDYKLCRYWKRKGNRS